MHLQELKNVGLSENEARVYLAALELGETSVYRLAKKSGVKRTTTYLAVETLMEKGLMSSYRKNNVVLCYAESPKKLIKSLEEKKKALENVMPELLAFTNLIDKKPKIHYFEGKKAYREVFDDVLNYPSSEMLGTFNEKFWDYENYFTSYFMPKRKEKKIWARILLQGNPNVKNITEEGKKYFFQSKLVPVKEFKIEIEMIVYGSDKLGMVSYDEEMAIIIESKKIHNTQKGFFEAIWRLVS